MLARHVHSQNGAPLGLVGQRDLDLPVEPAGPEEGRVEHLRAVGGRHDHHPGAGVEAVHLGQKLIEGLFPLVVGAERTPTALADGVDLVDEDDGRGPFAGIGEEVPHSGGAHSDEQLDEARAGEGEERHLCLAGYRPGHQGLARSRRSDHQHPPRSGCPGLGVALRMTQEVDHLGHLLLRSLVPGDVGQPGGRPVLVVHLGLRPADTLIPASCLELLRPIQMKTAMNKRMGRNDNRSSRRADPCPTPVTSTSCAFSVGASWVSVIAVGI